ncbi:KRI1-like family C-terminal-domain-containing protein [Dactylonectria macrodidyma]|uniref:KRI1-like family C-terminal-domain-containing protein n=1 Tax=Dactylonectria macrodidyma TaxID=307937 RepID=A0A9P9J6V2_9HYPO|nr:KRI1-like family C-terminal-domain-containing protein [Dactylonectria macrodidyma]
MGKSSKEPQRSKRTLLDDSDSESDGGAPVAVPELQVNEEFARRFEHNKKREEQQRLEEKYKKGRKDDDEDDDSSSDESEDEDGFLATEDLDAQISATLQAIRNKDPKVYDKDVTFYNDTDGAKAVTDTKEKKDKPIYLRDYHREKLLAGDAGAFDDEGDAPKNYHEEQDDLKKSIMTEIHAATAGDVSDEEEGGFLRRKEEAKSDAKDVHPSRKSVLKVTELDVANADKNPENFLSNFMSARAWVPPDGSNWKAFESDEGEGDDNADEFEQAYNLRFEDPEKSNEVLRTYARDLAASKSVRREEKNSRKRQRELEREKKEAAKQERRDEKTRLRKLKLNEAEEKLRKIKQAVGSVGKELKDEDWIEFLDAAWENDKWEEEMLKRFGDDYYAQADEGMRVSDDDKVDGSKGKKKHPKKPKWEDDIDINDIVSDFDEEEEKPKISLSDVEEGDDEKAEDEDAPPSKKRKTADHKRNRQETQKKARQERSKLEALVDSKLELTNHALLNKPDHTPFRYRETSPQSFGMTPRDILLAPSDQVLNEFAGLKKLATFRDEEKKRRDRKTLGKKARLRQWRRGTFGAEFERTGPTYGFERLIDEEDVAAAGAVLETKDKEKKKASNVVGDGEERKKKRKRSKGKKATAPAAEAKD